MLGRFVLPNTLDEDTKTWLPMGYSSDRRHSSLGILGRTIVNEHDIPEPPPLAYDVRASAQAASVLDRTLRTDMVGIFPDEADAVRLACAILLQQSDE